MDDDITGVDDGGDGVGGPLARAVLGVVGGGSVSIGGDGGLIAAGIPSPAAPRSPRAS